MAAQAGYPLITIPAGTGSGYDNMPYGLMLMGTAYSEPDLIKYSSAIEDLQLAQPAGYPWRRTPPQWASWRERPLPISSGLLLYTGG